MKTGDPTESIEDLDAITAAPHHHTVLLENSVVRVLDSLLKPGESTPVHTHSLPGVQYYLGFSDFIRRDPDGNVLLDSRANEMKAPTGTALWSGPLEPHYVTNVGETELRVISIELKNR